MTFTLNDRTEANAIYNVFQNNKELYVNSIKGAIGHVLGGGGALEAIASILTIKNGIIPLTCNLIEIDEEFKNISLVYNASIRKEIKYAMSNSFGFGGNNVSLVFGKFDR